MKTLKVPSRLVRFYSKRAMEGKYAELEKSIEAARLCFTTQELVAASAFYSLITFFLALFLEAVIFVIYRQFIIRVAEVVGLKFLDSLTKFSVITHSYQLETLAVRLYTYGNAKVGLAIVALFCFLVSVALALTVRMLILAYPEFVASRRRGEIDLYLPHAVNMMYGMASGGISAYEMVKAVAEAKFMFGELSREFETIVNLVELFDDDLITAMNYVRETTPSEQLSSLLDDMIFILKGGGKLSTYFASKSRDLLQKEEVSYSGYLEFLSLMTETYLSVFILFPLFLLIILVVMKVTGENFLNAYVYALYVALPVSTIFFAYLIKSSMPVAPARLIKADVEEDSILLRTGETEETFRIRKFKRFFRKLKTILLSPLRSEIYVVDVRIVACYVAVFSAFVSYLAYRFLPSFFIPISVSSLALPMILFIELRDSKLKKIESRIPEVFRELALLNEAGLTIIESLKMLSNLDFGELTKELKIVRRRMEWGEPVARAFKVMEERVRSDIMAKVIPVSVKVLEVSPTFKDAFHTVAHFAEAEVMLRERIRSGMLLYVIIIYMSVFVFLIVVYVLIHNMFSAFHVSSNAMGIFLNVGLLKQTFYRVAVLVSALSGIIAGVIGNGKVSSGLKHSYVFLMATYILFNYLL